MLAQKEPFFLCCAAASWRGENHFEKSNKLFPPPLFPHIKNAATAHSSSPPLLPPPPTLRGYGQYLKRAATFISSKSALVE